MDGGIPISEFAAQSPENAAIIEQFKKDLDSGKISMCACMGPMYGEPFCICSMERQGLPLNVGAREIEQRRSDADLKRLFGPGGFFYQGPEIKASRSRNQREGKMIIGRLNKHDVAYRKIALLDKPPKVPTRWGQYDPQWREIEE